MKKSWLGYLLLGILLVIPIVILLFDDNPISIDFGINKYKGYNLTGIQNITGKIIISPTYNFDRYNRLFSYSKKVNLEVYSLTYKKAIDMFKTIATRGGKIKMILENKKYKQFGGDYNKLKSNLKRYGIDIKSDEQLGLNYLHSKFVFDKEKFVIQTANLVYSAFFKNREYFFVSKNQSVLDNLNYIFYSDFSGTKIKKNKIHPNLLVCPINCRSKIETLLMNAKKSILIQNQYIMDQRIKGILNTKKNLQLKIILADRKENKSLKHQFQDQLKLMKKPYLHAKTMLIDNKYLLIGSINFSSNSIDNNREVAILLVDDKLIRKYQSQFYKDRSYSK